ESPGQETSDAEGLMFAFMGEDQEDASVSVGGPLYPPIQALWFYPYAWLPPQIAYRLVQCLNLVGAFAAGLGLTILSRGRIWWPLASLAVMFFPGFAGSLGLGQNAVFSLNVLVWGWVLVAQTGPMCGGLVWGHIGFKR